MRFFKKTLVLSMIVLMLCITACDSSEEVPQNNIGIDYGLIEGEKNGACYLDYYIQDDCITSNKKGWYEISTYDNVDLENICLDPTCSHVTGSSCTANPIAHDNTMSRSICVTYNNKLIVLDSYLEQESDGGLDDTHTWITDVYEADLDGSNRKCVLSFNGSFNACSLLDQNVMCNGKMYFGGEKYTIYRCEMDEEGMPVWSSESEHAFFCVDLNDYTLTEYLTGPGELSSGDVYMYDDVVYIAERRDPNYRLYRITEDNEVEKLLEKDRVIIPVGVIEDEFYYYYQNDSANVMYSMKFGSDEETVFAENVYHAEVMYGKIYVLQTGWTDDYSKHIVYDTDGNIVDIIEYDEYMYFCGNVGDKVIYYDMAKVGIVDIENIKDIDTYGQDIGLAF